MKYFTFAAALIVATEAVTIKGQSEARFTDVTVDEYAENLGAMDDATRQIMMDMFHSMDANSDGTLTGAEYNAFIMNPANW